MLEKIKNFLTKNLLVVKFVVAVVISLFIIGMVIMTVLNTSLEKEFNAVYPTVRSMMLARMLSDRLADSPWSGNDPAEVQRTLTSYNSSYKDYGLSYIIVQDEKNELVATTLGTNLPPDLIKANKLPQGKEIQNIRFMSEGKIIQDVAVVIGDLKQPKGVVRVGVFEQSENGESWETIKQERIYGVQNPVKWATFVSIILIGALLIFFFYKVVMRRIQYLIEVTEKMSFVDLDVNVVADSTDELGRLAENLKMACINLKGSIERLKKRKQ